MHLKIKKVNPDEFSDYMNKIKPETYTQFEKLICDWPHKENYLILYRMLKFYVGQGMIIGKVHNKISFRQSKWLEKNISFKTQNHNWAKNKFEKIARNYSIMHSMVKRWKMFLIGLK